MGSKKYTGYKIFIRHLINVKYTSVTFKLEACDTYADITTTNLALATNYSIKS